MPMSYDIKLRTQPSPLPLKPAVIILLHKRRKSAFVSYTSNARGRVSVLANVIRHREQLARKHLRDMPPGEILDFAVLAEYIGLEPERANRMVKRVKNRLINDGYKLFGGQRNAEPIVILNGKRLSIVDAMSEAK